AVLDVAAEGLNIEFRGRRGGELEAQVAAHRTCRHVAAYITADAAAHRLQLEISLHARGLEIRTDQGHGHRTPGRHMDDQARLAVGTPSVNGVRHDMNGSTIARAGHFHAVDAVAGRAADLDFVAIPSIHLHRSRYVDDLNFALRIRRPAFIDRLA